MNTPAALLGRLETIGDSLASSTHALALIGLGSSGQDRHRLDAYSDLDFFAVVEDGHAQAYIENLDWLARVHPIAYAFRNTADGYKLLFADGIFCEFAVFEMAGLLQAAYTPGQVVWKRPGISDFIAAPARPLPGPGPLDINWQVGEALTNLYVGLQRFRRGEKLSAMRFIQGYAVDRVLALAVVFPQNPQISADPFSPDRRFEQRYPGLADLLPSFLQGYDRSPQSAAALLAFLEQHFSVEPAIAQAIRSLLED